MNRGFCYYFKSGLSTAANVVYRGGQFFRYYLYFFATIIGRLIPFFGAVFPVADMRRAKIAKNEKTLSFVRSFKGVDSANGFGTAVLSLSLELMVLLGGFAAFGMLGYGLYVLGEYIGVAVSMNNPRILAVIIALPAAVAALIFAVAVIIMFAPMPYIIDSNKNVSATGVMTAATETMRRSGKATCFLNKFIPLLIKAAYLTAAYFVLYGILHIDAITADVAIFISAGWVVIALVIYMLFAPIFTLGSDIANAMLFSDISLDPAAMNNRTKGVFIKKARENTLEGRGLDSNLYRLFDSVPPKRDSAPDTKYVPPTDYEAKMRLFTETTEPAENEDSAYESAAEVTPDETTKEINDGVDEL